MTKFNVFFNCKNSQNLLILHHTHFAIYFINQFKKYIPRLMNFNLNIRRSLRIFNFQKKIKKFHNY